MFVDLKIISATLSTKNFNTVLHHPHDNHDCLCLEAMT